MVSHCLRKKIKQKTRNFVVSEFFFNIVPHVKDCKTFDQLASFPVTDCEFCFCGLLLRGTSSQVCGVWVEEICVRILEHL